MMSRIKYMVIMLLLLAAGRMAAQAPVLDSVCAGAERYYRVDGETGSTYSWLLTDPLGNTTLLPSGADTLQITWNFAPGIYDLECIQHALNGCDADAVSGQVIIFEAPDVYAGFNDEICEDGSYHLIFATAENTRSIRWTSMGDGAFDNDTLLDAIYFPGAVDIITGYVVLTITGYGLGDPATCAPASATMLLTISTEVIPTFDLDPSLCQFSVPPVLPTTSANDITGTWDPPVINTTNLGMVVHTFTPEDSACAVPLEWRVTVYPQPDVYAGADQTIPYGNTTTIGDATASGTGPLGIHWSPALLLVDPTVINPTTVPLTMTTTFILQVTDSIGCESVDTVIINVAGTPLAVNAMAIPDTICAGASVQLFANATGGSGTYSYLWTSIPPGFNSILPNPVAVPAVSTMYIVEVNDGVDVKADSVTVIVNPLPEVYAGANQSIPLGSSTTIADATASGSEPLAYSWVPANLLLDPTVLHPTTVPMAITTVFTLTVTDVFGCQNSDQVTIFVIGNPLAVNPTADPDTVCPGGSSQLRANATGGTGNYTYLWTSIPPGFISTAPDPIVTPLVTTIYNVQVDDGLSNITDFVTVTVNPLPVVYAGADQTIPTGTSTTIGDATASGTEPLTYSWTPAAFLVDPTVLQPVTTNLTVSTTFTLTVTDAAGCSSSDAMIVFVEGGTLAVNPRVEPHGICEGGTAQLFANATGGSGNYTYSWTSDPAGFVSTEADPVVSPAVTTIYTVEVNDGFSTVTGEVTLTVNPLPVVFAGNDQTVLPGTAVTIADATATGAAPMTYSWAPDALLVDPTLLNPVTIALNATTTFTLTVTDVNGCSNSDQMTVYVSGELLIVSPAAEPDTICAGETVQLSANALGGTGNYTFLWSSIPAGFTSTDPDPLVAPSETTVYTVEVDDGDTTVTASVTVTVWPLPLVTCPGDVSICESADILQLTGATPQGGVYSGTGVYQSGDDYFFDPSAGTGNYIISYTYTDAEGCSNSCTFGITVRPNPIVTAVNITPETNSNQNGAIQITANGSTPELYYTIDNGATWQTNDGLFVSLSGGTYQCIVRDQNGCDTAFVVFIENLVSVPLEAITGPDDHCLGNAAVIWLKVDNFIGVASFQLRLRYNAEYLTCEGYQNPNPALQNFDPWAYPPTGEIILTWESTVPVTFTGTATVCELVFFTKQVGIGQLEWYTGSTESYFLDINGQPVDAVFEAGEIQIYQPPVIMNASLKNVCEGEAVTLTGIASATYPPVTYSWIYPDGTVHSEDPHFDSVTLADAGDYRLLATDAMYCTDEKTIRLRVNANPVADFHGADTLTVPRLYALDAGGGYASYLWNTGETTESVVVLSDGWYWVKMISNAGCVGIDSVYVIISGELPEECIFIPNAFTPDGDGLNDVFKAISRCPLSWYEMVIFNRWGEELFETNDINEAWDGTKHGTLLPGDSYVYRISYQTDAANPLEGKELRTGVVILLK